MGIGTWAAACAAAMVLAAGTADAGVIFSSIPDLTVAPEGDWNATTAAVAGSFTLTKTELVTGFAVVADLTSDLSFESFYIAADDNGKPGEELLGAAGTPGNGMTYTVTPSDTRLFNILIPTGPIRLAPGTYWFGISSPQTGVEGFSGGSGSMVQCSETLTTCTPTGQTMGFDVLSTGSAVPEPATWAVMILGLFMLGAAARRHGLVGHSPALRT
jgi:hypothetical protein